MTHIEIIFLQIILIEQLVILFLKQMILIEQQLIFFVANDFD
jgi:hypothetical protein